MKETTLSCFAILHTLSRLPHRDEHALPSKLPCYLRYLRTCDQRVSGHPMHAWYGASGRKGIEIMEDRDLRTRCVHLGGVLANEPGMYWCWSID